MTTSRAAVAAAQRRAERRRESHERRAAHAADIGRPLNPGGDELLTDAERAAIRERVHGGRQRQSWYAMTGPVLRRR